MIESGKTLEAWTPYQSKEDTLGYLYNATGSLNLQKDPGLALKDFIKAAQFNGKISKLPTTYATIAQTYEASAYAKLASDYEAKYKGKDETPESKLAVENINQVVDRMIDAYARAVALAGTEPAEQANKKLWMEQLTNWYNYRNKSTAGLDQLIAGILAKPMPGEPTPLTKLPASATGPATTTPDTASASGSPAKPAAQLMSHLQSRQLQILQRLTQRRRVLRSQLLLSQHPNRNVTTYDVGKQFFPPPESAPEASS